MTHISDMYVVKTRSKYEAESSVEDSALEPLQVSKEKRAKSIELQERKHTALQKGAQLKSGANHKIQSSIHTVRGRHQSTEKVNYVALTKHKTLNGCKPQS